MSTPASYTTVDGDMLDAICFKTYGREGMVSQVLEANPKLAALGPVFQAGVVIALPEDAQPAKVAVLRLWN